MIKLLGQGDYELAESKGFTKLLQLSGEGTFAWVNAKGIGEILVASSKKYPLSNILALGRYRLYQVLGEDKLADTTHLELFVGKGVWQGYLLVTGLPSGRHKRARIISTSEIISKSSSYFEAAGVSSLLSLRDEFN